MQQRLFWLQAKRLVVALLMSSPMSTWRRTAIGAAVVVCLVLAGIWVLFGDYLRVSDKVDACLDAGGAWDYKEKKCIGASSR